MSAAILAFLHHTAAFLIVAALTVELIMMKGELNVTSARTLLRLDAVYGMSAAILLAVGMLRVFLTEKGAAYYFHSGTFLAKLTLFIVIGLLSIYPTMQFLGWRKALKAQQAPVIDASTRRNIRLVLHIELTLLFVMVFLAVLMARGIGYMG